MIDQKRRKEAHADFIEFLTFWVDKYCPERASEISIYDTTKVADMFLYGDLENER